jgi:hypothetical protein
MEFFTFIFFIFILLIFISIINTLIYFALKLVTYNSYEEHYLIIPSFLSIVLWTISLYVIFSMFFNINNIGVIDFIISIIFKSQDIFNNINQMILPTILIIIGTITMQSLCLLTVNLDYYKYFNFIMFYIRKLFKKIYFKITKKELIFKFKGNIIELPQKYRLTLFNSLIASLFIFSLIFFVIILLFFLGNTISNNII